LIELILALPIKTETYGNKTYYSSGILYKRITDAFEMSDINASLTIVDKEVLFYPRGEEILDQGLVEERMERGGR
jgi:hypothetical protein